MALQRQQAAKALSPAEDSRHYDSYVSSRLYAGRFFCGRDQIPGGETQKMPNAKVLSEKQAIVEALAERIKSASAGLFIDYKGINVAEDTKLRRELSANGVEYSVVKNTLVRFALDKTGLSGIDPILNGTTSLATSSEDPIAPFRIVNDYSTKMGERFNVKAAFMDGKVLNEQEIVELSKLPSKDALYSIVLGTMLAPITSLAVVLNQIVEKNGAPAEEAPAEEAAPAEAAPEAAE